MSSRGGVVGCVEISNGGVKSKHSVFQEHERFLPSAIGRFSGQQSRYSWNFEKDELKEEKEIVQVREFSSVFMDDESVNVWGAAD